MISKVMCRRTHYRSAHKEEKGRRDPPALFLSRSSRPYIAVMRRVNIPTPAYPHLIAVLAVVAPAVLLLCHRDPALMICVVCTEVGDQQDEAAREEGENGGTK